MIQNRIEDRLSDAFLEGIFVVGVIIRVDVNADGAIVLERVVNPEPVES